MKIRRPRTLLGMVLMGLAFVTVPLLVAVGNAMIKLGQLAGESELVLADSATAALENQRLAPADFPSVPPVYVQSFDFDPQSAGRAPPHSC